MPRYYDSGDTIRDLILQGGRSAADRARRQGEAAAQQAQGWSNLFSTVAQGAGQVISAKQEEKRVRDARAQATAQGQALDALFAEGKTPEYGDLRRVVGDDKAIAIMKGLEAIKPTQADPTKQYQDRMERVRDAARGVGALPPDKREPGWQTASQGLVAAGVIKPEEVQPYSEDLLTQYANYGVQPKGPEPVKAPNLQTVETAEGIRAFNPQTGEMGPVIGRPKPAQGPRPDYQWVQKDGEWIEVPKGAAPQGWKPASTREQGRPVTSGDAGRIADFKTSLDDLKELSTTLAGSKSTGVGAQIGAALPNSVTELTGLGSDAKQKQAVIDRVKQVIGKTLEGGVLRAEDERKYSKILPTIGDPPAVVKTKLEGLQRAIEQRQSTFVDALSDAGYDTTKYGTRAAGGEQNAPPKQIKSDADYDALPSGAVFIGPDGKRRKKP